MPIRPNKWWELFDIIQPHCDDQEECAQLTDIIWAWFGRKLP